MIRIPFVRFSGFQDYLTRSPKVRPNLPEIYNIDENLLDDVQPCYKGFVVRFPDQSQAYLHPFESNCQRRVGASVLSRLLGFNIVPDTRAIEVPRQKLSSLNDGKIFSSLFGTLCDWVHGLTAKHYLRVPQNRHKPLDEKNLIELYLFFLIAMDADFHGNNIIVKDCSDPHGQPVLFAIDNEKTGAKKDLFLKSLNKFPERLRQQIEGKPIPVETLEKLRRFVENKSGYTQQLVPYYFPAQAENFFRVAQKLYELKVVPNLGMVYEITSGLLGGHTHAVSPQPPSETTAAMFKIVTPNPQVTPGSTLIAGKTETEPENEQALSEKQLSI